MANRLFLSQFFSGCMAIAWLMVACAHADDQLLNRRGANGASSSVSSTAAPGVSRKTNLLELKFKAAPRTESSVVKLGDLIEVVSWGSHADEDILALPLSPAPKLGASQDWTSRDLIHHLQLRGLPAAGIKWLGPESARLVRVQPTPPAVERAAHTPAFIQARTITQQSPTWFKPLANTCG